MKIIIYYDPNISTPNDICKAVLVMTKDAIVTAPYNKGRVIRLGLKNEVCIEIIPIDDSCRANRCSLSFYPEHLKENEHLRLIAECATMSDIVGYYDQKIFEKRGKKC